MNKYIGFDIDSKRVSVYIVQKSAECVGIGTSTNRSVGSRPEMNPAALPMVWPSHNGEKIFENDS